ncbi:aromatic amino acid ammonia-lyase [Streptomyces sp. NPDC006430]|uniref:HAL/PAL/TAL family ammonia-lyase n=1 Tax=Streptomyces sp. NPDC006430 TaxID=3154299 RepID=UPI0033ACA979
MSTSRPADSQQHITLDGHRLTLDDVRATATGTDRRTIALSEEARTRMAASVRAKEELIASGAALYGVTTGFGDSSDRQISAAKTEALQRNLLRFLRVGVGPYAAADVVRATMLIRANCSARGNSAIREEPVALLLDLLRTDLLPRIPERGSVGASGDLAPLSYLAAALTGEGTLLHKDRELPAAEALRMHGLKPVRLQAKEALALVNGTSFMAAYAALAHAEARELARAAELCTALTAELRCGPAEQFAPFPHDHKPHPGQANSAARIHGLLTGSRLTAPPVSADTSHSGYVELDRHIQDPYSIRCAPHVIGVLHDTLEWTGRWLTIEINSSNDNPLFDADTTTVHNSGNFYGGHVAHAAQALTSAVASVADLLDRQLQLLVDDRYSHGLPANLAPLGGPDEAGLHHGFKGAQIAASALTAEALHLSMPAGSFSRSTESHNQDKVSMGTIAARHAHTATRLATHVAGIHLLALAQAADLRGPDLLAPATRAAHTTLRRHCAVLDSDRPLDEDISRIAALIHTGTLHTQAEDC